MFSNFLVNHVIVYPYYSRVIAREAEVKIARQSGLLKQTLVLKYSKKNFEHKLMEILIK
jgi:hypothetical protein